MKRKFSEKLLAWKNNSLARKPLLVYGARQVGKTYIIKDFAQQHFKSMVYLNFEKKPELRSIFEGDLSPIHINSLLEAYFSIEISAEHTLIFFDEVQLCPLALTSLKYFAEEAREYCVIAAGSLLGVAVNKEKISFPVGKVQIETLYPMDFEEFLWALNKHKLIEMVRECFQSNQALLEIFHKQAKELFYAYLLIGGMPEVVDSWINAQNYLAVQNIQNNILTAYLADMAKYTSASVALKVRTAYLSIPAQLAKENKKFQYKLLKKGASASHFGEALDWLEASGIVIKCQKVDQGLSPLAGYVDLSAFKLYMSDVGLLSKSLDLSMENLLSRDAKNLFKGAIMENYVAQCLVCKGYKLYYWESQSIAELDFIVNLEGSPIPIEVKSSENVRSRSLGVYIKKYNPAYSIRVSMKNFGLENNIKTVPLYAVFLI